jgi:adenylylsulfate kinase-like enzyme
MGDGTVINAKNEHKKGMVIGLVGLIGSGKDTIADYLCNFEEFRRESFASTLKDACAAVFGWDRT